MNSTRSPPGKNPPYDINVVIEIPGGAGGGAPVKYEIDKESGALFVDRIVNMPMFYPNNYGFVPNTLHEDGDPVDVHGPHRGHAGRRLGHPLPPDRRPAHGGRRRHGRQADRHADREGRPVPGRIQELQDMPQRHRERIWHFFEHYKALEQGKWAKITGWGDKPRPSGS